MLLIDFIKQLQNLYDKEMSYYDTYGEPTIHVDLFNQTNGNKFVYAGISESIKINYVHGMIVICGFKRDYNA